MRLHSVIALSARGTVRANPQPVLQRGRPDRQKGPISFVLLFKAPKSIDDKPAKKYYMQKGEGLLSVCFFVSLS